MSDSEHWMNRYNREIINFVGNKGGILLGYLSDSYGFIMVLYAKYYIYLAALAPPGIPGTLPLRPVVLVC